MQLYVYFESLANALSMPIHDLKPSPVHPEPSAALQHIYASFGSPSTKTNDQSQLTYFNLSLGHSICNSA
jgi:hypothetical protein